MSRLVTAMAYAAVLGLAGGCGVPSDPTPIAITRVPYDLMNPPATTSAGPSTAATRGPFVYLLDSRDRAVPVELDVVDELPSGTITAILARLSQGPSDDERRAGLSSALGHTATLTLRSLENGRAEIAVGPGEREPSADRLPLAVGQIVLSVTSVSGVASVVLTDGTDPIAAPLPDGARTDRPLVRADYAALLEGSTSRP